METPSVYPSFAQEIVKTSAGRDIGKLLSSLAERQGLRPSMFPSIKQVQNVATRDRGRASEIAKNIRSTLKSHSSQAA